MEKVRAGGQIWQGAKHVLKAVAPRLEIETQYVAYSYLHLNKMCKLFQICA